MLKPHSPSLLSPHEYRHGESALSLLFLIGTHFAIYLLHLERLRERVARSCQNHGYILCGPHLICGEMMIGIIMYIILILWERDSLWEDMDWWFLPFLLCQLLSLSFSISSPSQRQKNAGDEGHFLGSGRWDGQSPLWAKPPRSRWDSLSCTFTTFTFFSFSLIILHHAAFLRMKYSTHHLCEEN